MITLAEIASRAPSDLLDYRHRPLAHPSVAELLTAAEEAHAAERSQRQHLAQDFYLDALPRVEELRTAIRAFRRGDSLLNVFDSEWRSAKKLFKSACRTKARRRAADYEAHLDGIVAWIEQRTSFIGNEEFKNAFGPLFRGLDTDFSKIRRLQVWYAQSHTEMVKHPGFIESIDLSTLDSTKLIQLAAHSARLHDLAAELTASRSDVEEVLGPVSRRLDSALSQFGWRDYNRMIGQVANGLRNVVAFLSGYVKPDVSPKRAIDVLRAKCEVLSVSGDIEVLNQGLADLQRIVEPFLPGIVSIPCRHWTDYLAQLAGLADAAGALADFAMEFGPRDGTPAGIRNFFAAKLMLDARMEMIAPLSEKGIQDWSAYIATARRGIQAGMRLATLLKPICAADTSASNALAGLSARKEARGLISSIANDRLATTLLGESFRGEETDVESLAATLSWGERVVDNAGIRDSGLRALLLAPEACSNFHWARQRLQHVLDCRERVRGKFEELNEFGSFSEDVWQSAHHAPAMNTSASTLLLRVETAARHTEAILPWAKYHAERIDCKNAGLGDFVAVLEQKRIPSSAVGAVFEFVAYRSVGRAIYKRYPELEGFAGAKHEKRRAEFNALDKDIIGLTGKAFGYDIDKAKKVPDGVSGYRASERSEMQLVRHELGKQRRHLPIRQLIKRAGRAIQELKPCFMMGPMSVAQYLEQGAVEFDMVVMDEASQLRPEEALGAIARGKQLVVVGDPKQLPPTNFFDRLVEGGDEEDEDTPAVLVGSESILDICQQLFHPVRTLRWHYRSQHESLIAFSNHHFYNGKLIAFPSPFDRNHRLGVRYRYIRNGAYKGRQNLPEALCIVDAIINHMTTHPEECLGVVTLNQTQRDLIEDLLEKKLRNIEEAQRFIANWEKEGWPFFIKNLENVQGDERDVIFISTTFGKAPGTDKVRQQFGPISRPDGWRRLNVLFTRARRKIELFTSMLPEDIVLDTTTPAGTRALRDYLDFAKRGVLSSTDIGERDADSDFEIAVGELLCSRGYEVVPQLGVAGFFIDLAVRNPDRPGEFLAAIECDGAAYHSSNSARDRDRIRQAILESLGWKDRIWRIWSTDWFYNPRREMERLLAFLEERRAIPRSEPTNYYDEEELNVTDDAQGSSAEELDATVAPSAVESDPTLTVRRHISR